MVSESLSESLEQRVMRLERELASERARADAAETQLQRVHAGVRAFKEKQEQVIRARKAREARALEAAVHEAQNAAAANSSATQSGPQEVMISSGVAEAWDSPDPSLDDRLDRYLESSFEPDRSRNWMLKD